MTKENSERLIAHYKKLIADPSLAFPANARVKAEAKENVVEYAKKHLVDMEENLKIRSFLKTNPDTQLDPATITKKLEVPAEALEKGVVEESEKKKKDK